MSITSIRYASAGAGALGHALRPGLRAASHAGVGAAAVARGTGRDHLAAAPEGAEPGGGEALGHQEP